MTRVEDASRWRESQVTQQAWDTTSAGRALAGPLPVVPEADGTGLHDLPPLEPGVEMRGAERLVFAKEVAKVYKNGVSMRRLAEHLQRSETFVHDVLHCQSVVPMRRRGKPRATTR
ncbi:MAG: Helix-turn-helix domain [Solirubrobacteraceae bacterium]